MDREGVSEAKVGRVSVMRVAGRVSGGGGGGLLLSLSRDNSNLTSATTKYNLLPSMETIFQVSMETILLQDSMETIF